jgi:hypothetical protein
MSFEIRESKEISYLPLCRSLDIGSDEIIFTRERILYTTGFNTSGFYQP